MRALRDIFLTMLLAFLAAPLAHAQLGGLGGKPNIDASLRAETLNPAPGTKLTVAFDMRPHEGWHGYWRNPGDAGLPMEAKWTLPKGVSASDLQYPVPQRLLIANLMNYVFEGPYALLATLDVPADARVGTRLPVAVEARWLACTDKICVPESAQLSLDLTIGDGKVAAADQARFDTWRAAIAKPLDAKATYALANGRARFAIPWPAGAGVSEPYLYPVAQTGLDHAAAQSFSRNGDRLIVETAAKGDFPARFEGMLAIGGGKGLDIVAEAGPVPPAGLPVGDAGKSDAAAKTGIAAILLALGGAILGGLTLNIMPCVFPILSLKALSLARAGESDAQARSEAVAYTLGAVAMCVALGAALLGLRAGGAALGWAFQLQDPRIVLFLLVLMSAIALNLAGLFELPSFGGGAALAGRSGRGGAFWTGALAAFVATPCTGPFMAAALGAALVLPWAAALAIFAGLGLGLALPFLLLGWLPALRNRLPRPGPWMTTMRAILSIPMFLTALGLAWLLGQQRGVDGMTMGLGITVLVALALWWLGARQHKARSVILPALIALILLAGGVFALPTTPAAKAQAGAHANLGAEPFSEARLAALRQSGRPVFLYFTADWCLTCKANEAAAIDRAEVSDAFTEGNVAVMVGDWTNSDAAIGRFLSAHGRSGVPLYLFYAPGKEAQELPQVLTPGTLTALAKSGA